MKKEKTLTGAKMVLCTERSRSLFKHTRVYSIFYGDSVVLAHLSREREKIEKRAMRRVLRQKKETPLRALFSEFNWWMYYGNRYYALNIPSILNEDAQNIRIYHRNIQSVLFTASQEDAELEDEGDWLGNLIFKTDLGPLELIHNYRDTNQNIRSILTNLYPDRLEYISASDLLLPTTRYQDQNRRFY